MAFFGLPRGRVKALSTVRLVLLNGNTTNNATLYYDSGFGNGQSGGTGQTVTYYPTTWLPLFATGGSGTATTVTTTVNNIEIFDSFGTTARLGTGASGSQVDFLLDLPGGNGFLPARVVSGGQLWIRPIAAFVFDPTAASQPEVSINFYD